jgi:integrase
MVPIHPHAVHPAVMLAKIAKRIGLDIFQRTFSTLLKANGEDVKVVQEWLWHASAKITLDVHRLLPRARGGHSRR